MDKVQEYKKLLALELELRNMTIQTQSSDIEKQRIYIALQREELLFSMSESEIAAIKNAV